MESHVNCLKSSNSDTVILIMYITVWRKILTVENIDESGLGKF